MDVYAKLIEIARRSNRDAISHVYRGKDGKLYEFDDYGKLRGEYLGKHTCDILLPPELEEQVTALNR